VLDKVDLITAHLNNSVSIDYVHADNVIYTDTVEVLVSAADAYVPKHQRNFYKFWWDEELILLKDESIQSNDLWKAAGKPRRGPIVYNESDANIAYDNFINNVNQAFQNSFKLTKLSRKRSKDKRWITSALKKSSKVKNKLYRRWMFTRSIADEVAYKKYRATFRKAAAEAENLYYRDMFNTKINSIKKLWENLNTVCSFKKNRTTKNSISQLRCGTKTVSTPQEISTEFNNYFSTVGNVLMEELNKTHPNVTDTDFIKY